jgi:hypothetical protein
MKLVVQDCVIAQVREVTRDFNDFVEGGGVYFDRLENPCYSGFRPSKKREFLKGSVIEPFYALPVLSIYFLCYIRCSNSNIEVCLVAYIEENQKKNISDVGNASNPHPIYPLGQVPWKTGLSIYILLYLYIYMYIG